MLWSLDISKSAGEYKISGKFLRDAAEVISSPLTYIMNLSLRFNKIATQGAPQMAVDKEANSLSRVYSYYSKFNLRLFYV